MSIRTAEGPAAELRLALLYSEDCPKAGWFGRGLDCRPCPKGGYCPGGDRIWPQPGWWGPPGGFAGWVAECPAPASRCIGGQFSLCMPQYDQSSEFCSRCAPEHYKRLRECVPCAGFFFKYRGACGRRTPTARADLKVPKDASH